MIGFYLLMALSILVSVANGCFLKLFGNRDIKNTGESFFFNGGISIVWILLLSALSIVTNDLTLSKGSLIYGCLYGVIIASFLLFKNLSLTSGPVSLTMLIGSSTFLLTTLFGLALGQDVSLLKGIGNILIFCSLFLCLGKSKKGEKQGGEKLTAKWFIFCLLFFLAGGGVGIIYMLFGRSDGANEINGMMLTASVTAMVLYFVIGTLLNVIKEQPMPKIHKSGWLYILLCGVASCVYMRLNLFLSTVIPSVIFFPVSNGSMVILSTVCGALFFKERLTVRQWIGMAVGAASIILVGLG